MEDTFFLTLSFAWQQENGAPPPSRPNELFGGVYLGGGGQLYLIQKRNRKGHTGITIPKQGTMHGHPIQGPRSLKDQ